MEFQEVVRRRRMVRDYSDEPVDPAVIDLALANAVRAPSAGFSQGWAFLVLDTPDDVRRFWAATADDLDEPDSWLAGMMGAPVVILPCSSKAAYLERYAAGRQGLDRPRRGALADAVLAHGRRDGEPADPADGHRRRAGQLLHRRAAGQGRRRRARRSASPTTTTRSA